MKKTILTFGLISGAVLSVLQTGIGAQRDFFF